MGLTQQALDEYLYATKVRHEGLTIDQARERWITEAQKGDIITDGVNQNEFSSVPLNPTGTPSGTDGAITLRQLNNAGVR
jgi:hypothetical protein